MIENLRSVFNKASKDELEMAKITWVNYNLILRSMAKEHGYSLETVAGVFSALSPNNSYYSNVRDCRAVLEAAWHPERVKNLRVHTYHNNKRKALRIAHGENPLRLLLFSKTRSFYKNLVDPLDPIPVTVDGHIYGVWSGKREALKNVAQRMHEGLYKRISDDIRAFSAEVDLIPNQVQACLWHVWRRLHGIEGSSQLELWHKGKAYAGLGYFPVEGKFSLL